MLLNKATVSAITNWPFIMISEGHFLLLRECLAFAIRSSFALCINRQMQKRRWPFTGRFGLGLLTFHIFV